MNGIWYYFYAFVIVWILAMAFRDKLENHNFEVNFPVIMWRTKRLRGFIDNIANSIPRFWKWYYNIGIIVSFLAMIFISYTLIASLQTITTTPSVSIILPGVEMPGSTIYVPFVYGFLALITVLVVHEFSHGVASRLDKLSIKSIGLLLVAIIPGAFVEPDEDDLLESSRLTRLRVYCAGSVANMSLAAIAIICTLLISSFVVPAVFYDDGIEISRVVTDSPCDGILKEGMVIRSINNESCNSAVEYSSIISSFKPNETVVVTTDSGQYNVKLGSNPNNASVGYMGVQAAYHYKVNDYYAGIFGDKIPTVIFMFLEFLKWVFILNLGIGLFNLLPIKPLDGGHMLEILLSYRLPEEIYRPIVKATSYIMVLIIFISLFYSFF